jgi:spermidine synthase
VVTRAPLRAAAGAAAFALLSAVLIWNVPAIPKELLAHGRYAATWQGMGNIVFAKEGVNASVAVSDFPNGVRTFHVAGKIQASSAPRDMRLQRLLGHLTTLASPNPRSVLVIGCGAGVTAGAVSIDPRVERTTIAEIEPLVPETAADYFGAENFGVIRNPRTTVHIDDGRHYLLTSLQSFDAITADPLDPWVKGAANLYTVEFLEAAKKRLGTGGVVTLYIQLFETDLDRDRNLRLQYLAGLALDRDDSAAIYASMLAFRRFPDGLFTGSPDRVARMRRAIQQTPH